MIFKHYGESFMAGTNVELGDRERPRFVITAIPPGSEVSISHNDGYYGKISDEVYIVIHDLYIGKNTYVSMTDINKAIERLNDDTVDSPDILMKKSESVGLHAYQPVKGYGKVCANCENEIRAGEISIFCKRNDMKLTRYNDLMEYCTVSDEERV